MTLSGNSGAQKTVTPTFGHLEFQIYVSQATETADFSLALKVRTATSFV